MGGIFCEGFTGVCFMYGCGCFLFLCMFWVLSEPSKRVSVGFWWVVGRGSFWWFCGESVKLVMLDCVGMLDRLGNRFDSWMVVVGLLGVVVVGGVGLYVSSPVVHANVDGVVFGYGDELTYGSGGEVDVNRFEGVWGEDSFEYSFVVDGEVKTELVYDSVDRELSTVLYSGSSKAYSVNEGKFAKVYFNRMGDEGESYQVDVFSEMVDSSLDKLVRYIGVQSFHVDSNVVAKQMGTARVAGEGSDEIVIRDSAFKKTGETTYEGMYGEDRVVSVYEEVRRGDEVVWFSDSELYYDQSLETVVFVDGVVDGDVSSSVELVPVSASIEFDNQDVGRPSWVDKAPLYSVNEVDMDMSLNQGGAGLVFAIDGYSPEPVDYMEELDVSLVDGSGNVVMDDQVLVGSAYHDRLVVTESGLFRPYSSVLNEREVISSSDIDDSYQVIVESGGQESVFDVIVDGSGSVTLEGV